MTTAIFFFEDFIKISYIKSSILSCFFENVICCQVISRFHFDINRDKNKDNVMLACGFR